MIEFINEQEKISFTNGMKELIRKSIEVALKFIGFTENFDVCVTLIDNEGIREINRNFRKIDTATDVLSFPMMNLIKPFDKYTCLDSTDKNLDTNAYSLGDIIISLEKAEEQAEEYGHSFDRELSFLTVHSALHLLGHDHIEEADRILMRECEEKILDDLNLKR